MAAGNIRQTQESLLIDVSSAGNIRQTQESLLIGVATSGNIRQTQESILINVPIRFTGGSVTLAGGPFMDLAGNPISNGTLFLEISTDAKVIGGGSAKIAHSLPISLSLDVNGNISGSPIIFPNDTLTPNTTYKAWVITNNHTQVWGPHVETVLSSPNPFTILGNWTTTN